MPAENRLLRPFGARSSAGSISRIVFIEVIGNLLLLQLVRRWEPGRIPTLDVAGNRCNCNGLNSSSQNAPSLGAIPPEYLAPLLLGEILIRWGQGSTVGIICVPRGFRGRWLLPREQPYEVIRGFDHQSDRKQNCGENSF